MLLHYMRFSFRAFPPNRRESGKKAPSQQLLSHCGGVFHVLSRFI